MLNPAKQGDLDGACGFYAIGNALTLLYPDKGIEEISQAVFSVFNKKYGDANSLIDGIYRNRLNIVLKGSLNELKIDHDCKISWPFWAKPVDSLKKFKQKLSDYNIGSGSIAILGYEYSKCGESDWYSHWTVIKKVTEKNLSTHDSSNECKRISFDKCRIWDNKNKHKSRPYRLSSTDLVIITRAGEQT